MAKSPFVARLDEVQITLTGLLKPLGFRRKGRTFNRSSEPGVVQVIDLQSGQFPIGRELPAEAAHLRPNLYGQFTVNLGVHVREVWETDLGGRPYPQFIKDYNCAIRSRLGALATGRDVWWSLDQPAASISSEVGPLIIEAGLPFLELFETRDQIIDHWIEKSKGRSSRARVDVAIILARRGRAEEASRLLVQQMEGMTHRGHLEYLQTLKRQLGL